MGNLINQNNNNSNNIIMYGLDALHKNNSVNQRISL